MTFNETTDAGSIDLSKINVTNSDRSSSVVLTGATASTSNSTSITITTTNAQHSSISGFSSPRNLSLVAGAIKDLAGNSIAATMQAVASYSSSDTTPPTVTFTAPNGTVTSTTQVLNVTTNENAVCRFDVADKQYASMTYTMQGTATTHNYTMSGLSDNTDYTYYIRCNDTLGNLMTTSAIITFTINTGADTTAPSLTGTAPSGLITDSTPILYVNTSEAASCKFDTSDVAYASMSYSMNGTGTTHNYTFTSALNDSDLVGDYVYYIRCNDTSGNLMTVSSFVSFVLDTDGNHNYTQWLYPIWDTLWLPSKSIMQTMGYTDFNISVMLSNDRFLHSNPYTDVYYYNGSDWAGYSPATGWAGSDLKYVNNTNDKPYWLRLNTSTVTIKTRFQI